MPFCRKIWLTYVFDLLTLTYRDMGEVLDVWMIFIPFPLILALGKLFNAIALPSRCIIQCPHRDT